MSASMQVVVSYWKRHPPQRQVSEADFVLHDNPYLFRLKVRNIGEERCESGIVVGIASWI